MTAPTDIDQLNYNFSEVDNPEDLEEEEKEERPLHNTSHKKLSKEENKDRKKLFKSAKAESRTHKTPKHLKKARDKKYKSKK